MNNNTVTAAVWLLCLMIGGMPIISMASSNLERINSIEVFTIAGEPVSNVPDNVPVIELDAPERLDARVSEGLSADLEAAQSTMRERMTSPEWQGIMQRYGDLYTGVTRAWMLRVEKLPAVVVDGRYVVYGQHDVVAAVEDIAAFIARGEE